METIIIDKQYAEGATLVNFKKKVLCYSKEQEILLYKKGYGIYIPTIEVVMGKKEEIIPISLEKDNLEPLLQVVSCAFQYRTSNNKLVKQYLKYIRDYYTYLVEFNSLFKKQLQPLHIEDESYIPTIMNIEEAIDYMNQIYSSKRGTQKVLEALYCKVKGKKYETPNTNI